MRKKEKEVTERADIEAIIRDAMICRLAMTDGERPYLVPLCFGYKDGTLYFHTGHEGKKMDILRKNPRVCFEMECGCAVKPGEKACDWSMQYRSVIGFGNASIVESDRERREAFDVIMAQYAKDRFDISENRMAKTAIIRVDIESMTGKASI